MGEATLEFKKVKGCPTQGQDMPYRINLAISLAAQEHLVASELQDRSRETAGPDPGAGHCETMGFNI